MATGHVRLRMRGAEAQFGLGAHARAEKGDIVVVGIEDARHGAATQFNGAAHIRGIDVL